MKIRNFLIYILIFTSPLTLPTQDRAIQSPESIAHTAKSFLQAQFDAGKSSHDAEIQTEIHIGQLDPRLRLPVCDQPLQAFVPPSSDLKGHSVIGIRCVGTNSWHIYVAVQIKTTRKVAVFARSMSRGQIITKEDIELVKRDTSQSRQSPVTNLDHLLGASLKRNVQMGEMAHRHYACLVCKGEKLTIVAENALVSVAMEGIALEDGFYGQSVSLKNSQSSRRIDGTVIAHNRVKVNL